MEDEVLEAMLLAVLDHYDLPMPGYGERAARCPVHDDAHASASINRGKGLFNCHACGASGSAAQIVMARESVDYRSALALINSMGVATTSAPVARRTQPRRGGRWVPPRLRSTA